MYNEIAVENDNDGRNYIEISADAGVVTLYAESSSNNIDIRMAPSEVLELIAKLSQAIAHVL